MDLRDYLQSSRFDEIFDRLIASRTTVTILGRPDGASLPFAPAPAPDPVELLVQFRSGVGRDMQDAALAAAGGVAVNTLRSDASGDLVVVAVAQGQAAGQVAAALLQNPNVTFAEPNAFVSVQGSNDPRYNNGDLWGMYGDTTSPANAFGSQAGEAWATGVTGSVSSVIGVIDSGIDYTHPDLYLNIWLNPGEVPSALAIADVDSDGLITFRDLNDVANAAFVTDLNGNGRIDAGDLLDDARWENGRDEDGNGRVDDLIGWDFVNGDNDPFDDQGHGTHVAGTIGALGNNGVGVAGVSWNVQVMALKFLSASGSGSLSGAISSVDYYTAAARAYDAGPANYIATNNSWGGGSASTALLDSIVKGAQADVLFVAAAGNSNRNNDTTASYPSNYSTVSAVGWEAVIAVASINSSGARSSFSNYGKATVDLAAPGEGVWSTTPNGTYSSYSGTSMATPHVSGALALLASANGALTGAQMRSLLLSTTEATASVATVTATGGRLDVFDLIVAGANVEPPPPPPPTDAPRIIYGTIGSETLVGGSGDDFISGIPSSGSNLGRGTVDRLTGGAGSDVFVLGDLRGRFYDDGNTRNAGTGDRAVITDFSAGDKIQLAPGNYFLRAATVGGESGTGVYFDSNTNGRFDSRDEMVGLVLGPKVPVAADLFTATSNNVPAPQPTPAPPPAPVPPPPGPDAPKVIFGTTGSDTLVGGSGDDVLSGIPVSGSSLGRGTVDRLTGGAGSDIFILGDARGLFYDNGSSSTAGSGDRAVITDFSAGDKIQLSAGTYFLRDVTINREAGTGIYFDSNNNGSWDSRDELVGHVLGQVVLKPEDFIWA